MDTMNWIENNIAESFNEVRDVVARTLTERIEEKCNHDVYDMEFGNWNNITIKSSRDEDMDTIVHVTSRRDDDGVIRVSMKSEDDLFDDTIEVQLDEVLGEAFDRTMLLGQLWDVYNLITSNPIPDLTENYNSLNLPPLTKHL